MIIDDADKDLPFKLILHSLNIVITFREEDYAALNKLDGLIENHADVAGAIMESSPLILSADLDDDVCGLLLVVSADLDEESPRDKVLECVAGLLQQARALSDGPASHLKAASRLVRFPPHE